MYGKPNRQLGAYQMSVQVPHRLLSKVPEKNNLQRIPAGLEGNHPKIVQVQGSGNTGRAHDVGSRASTVKYTTGNECVKFHGMPERKERLADVRQTRKFGNRHFWAEGYYVSTMGLNEATIRKYIEDQEKHDIALDKFSVREYDPFKGSSNMNVL